MNEQLAKEVMVVREAVKEVIRKAEADNPNKMYWTLSVLVEEAEAYLRGLEDGLRHGQS